MARILIVDDSPTEMYKLTAMLEKHGHQVLKAEMVPTVSPWRARKSPMRC